MKENRLMAGAFFIIGLVLLTAGVVLSFTTPSQTLEPKNPSATEDVKEPDASKETDKETVTPELPTTTATPDIPVPEEPVVPQAPTPSVTPNPNVLPAENFSNEAQLISFFEGQETYVTVAKDSSDSSVLDSIKNGFINIVDFLFYGKEIGGYTFNELTSSAKLKVIKIALSIDNKIDSYFPGYKDRIKSGYQNLKEKMAELYLSVTASLCEAVGETTCNQAKLDFENMKESFGFTFDLLKDLGGDIKDSIKDWYESFSGK